MSVLAAVIFDFDGIVLDSETAEFESHRRIYERYGAALTPDDWRDQIGIWNADDERRWHTRLCALCSAPPDWPAFEAERRRFFEELLPPVPMAGIRDLLLALTDARVPSAIASTSPADWVVPAAERLGIGSLFRAVVSGDDVARRKPAPDVYLEAARRLGVDPGRAVAIEDSAPGVAAARAAGMITVAIPHWLTERHDLSGAHLRVTHAGELSVAALERLLMDKMKTPMVDHEVSTALGTPKPGEGAPGPKGGDGGPVDFIRAIVDADIAAGKHHGRVATRFPPEPNGYLHIGHAKSICLNFGIAQERDGICNLRFDDTNPTKEDVEYVDAIKEDVRWLGFEWNAELYASNYFERLYQYATELITKGLAYVDSLNADEIRAYRGTLTEPGRNSPYRDRSVEENLDLFARMRGAEFPDGAHVLRAKIDMASPNFNMRDPTLYRIRHASHHRTGDAWCIYPMYDFAHPLSDAIEGITHSICTLEFEDHRPLYDWLVDNLIEGDKPRQYEFARLNLNYTVMSKRKLLQLVEQGHVTGWDDPRMPTITGLRRRGYTPESIRDFCARIGVAKKENVIDVAQLEHSIREDLNRRAPRVMGVLRPLKVVLTNYPEDQVEYVDVINNPEDAGAGTRPVPFGRLLYIEQDDFREDPPKKFFRLSPGKEVRLRCAYFITCQEVVKDDRGQIVELRCTYDPATRGGDAPDGRKVKATLHWVSAAHAIPAEVRLYDRLFSVEDPDNAPDGRTFLDHLNPSSLEVLRDCRVEPSLASAAVGDRVQFERIGYFCVDDDSRPGALVFNRTVSLRDTWAKIAQKENARKGV